MSDLEHNSLVFRIEQLEQHYQVLTEYITSTKRQLDRLYEQLDNQPVLDQLAELEQLLNNPLFSPHASVEVINPQTEASSATEEIQPQPNRSQPYEYQLVFDRASSRAVLLEALESAQERLIIVCPWLNRNSIDADLIQKLRDCLNRNCRIDIGWGHLSDRSRIGVGWRYNALSELRQIEQDYPNLFSLKLLGTHEKFLVCDSTFAMLGSHNMLTSSTQSAEREVGIRTTDPLIIQGLIERFENAQVLDRQTTNDNWNEESASLDNGEVLELQVLSKPENTYLIDIDAEVITLELDVSKSLKGATISVEELLKHYKAGERDFAGINLTCGSLYTANLSGVNLSGANLSGTSLCRANLTGANLTGADLSGANLSGAKLIMANLNSAKLIQADLTYADLEKASLTYANLTAASLSGANLMNACLKRTILLAANLESTNLRKTAFDNKTKLNGAVLRSANFAGQDLQQLNLSGVDLTKANLCAAWLCSSNLNGANLTSADLRGADLGYTNLEKANLKGADLTGASLEGAKLSGATMPNGTVYN